MHKQRWLQQQRRLRSRASPLLQRRGLWSEWTREMIEQHPTVVSRKQAHDFLKQWRARGKYPQQEADDLTSGAAFDWVGYLQGHPNVEMVAAEGIVKFEIRYLIVKDSNMRDHRCDFLAHMPTGQAWRLHPSQKAEALAVKGDPEQLFISWSMRDGTGGAKLRVQCVLAASQGPGSQFYMNLSDSDRIGKYELADYLEKHGEPLRDVTEPDGTTPFLAWHVLFGTTPQLEAFLPEVVQVCTCRTNGSPALLARLRDRTWVLVESRNKRIVASTDDRALASVQAPSCAW